MAVKAETTEQAVARILTHEALTIMVTPERVARMATTMVVTVMIFIIFLGLPILNSFAYKTERRRKGSALEKTID